MAALTDLTLADLSKALASLFAIAFDRSGSVRSVSCAIAYSTTLGTVKKPPACLSVGSM